MPPKSLCICPCAHPSLIHVRSISPISFEVGIPNLMCGYTLGSRSVAYYFRVTWSWPLASFLEKLCQEHISNIIWGRDPKFGVLIHLGVGEWRALSWVTMTLTFGLNSIKIVYLGAFVSLWHISCLRRFLYPPQTLFVVGILFSRCPSVRACVRPSVTFTSRKLCLWWVYCFHVVHPSVRPSVTFCFFNILKSHCWIFIKPCKHVHICKTNT